MSEEEFQWTKGNLFEDLGLEDAEELTIRSDLLSEVNSLIRKSDLSQGEIAELLDIPLPKVSMLTSGKISAFSTDILMRYLLHLRRRKKIGLFQSGSLKKNLLPFLHSDRHHQ